jgi:DNA repair protein RecO (recombination protein O)
MVSKNALELPLASLHQSAIGFGIWGGRRADTRMPLRESEAIVLRTFPLGEGDRLVSFLGRSTGRLRGVAQGARRPKSRFGSTLEPLSHIRIWYYEKETRDLVRINQCELVHSFMEALRDYNSTVALALVSEMTEGLLPEREASDAVFRLVLLTSSAIERATGIQVPLAYFSLWMLKLGGWLGPVDHCFECGRNLEGQKAYASPTRPGWFCDKCRQPGLRLLSPEAVALAKRMLARKLEAVMGQTANAEAKELNEFLFDMVEHHTEHKLTSREMLEAQV